MLSGKFASGTHRSHPQEVIDALLVPHYLWEANSRRTIREQYTNSFRETGYISGRQESIGRVPKVHDQAIDRTISLVAVAIHR